MDEKNETGPAVEPKQARPHDELICELLDSRRPKTEREHAAAREIERLRDLCDDLYSDLLAAGSLAPRGCGAYALIQETIKLRRDRWARKQAPNAKSEPTAPLLAQVGSTDGLCGAVSPAPTF